MVRALLPSKTSNSIGGRPVVSKTSISSLTVIRQCPDYLRVPQIVSSGVKVYGEASSESTVESRAQQTAKEIATHLKTRFAEEGWI